MSVLGEGGDSPVGADGAGTTVAPPRQRSALFRVVVVALAAVFFVLFTALGTWQVKRRAWKLDLIARVEQRVHAPAVPAPGAAEWPVVTAATDEYRHVTANGTFLDASQTLVQAVTDLGAGYWVLTPLQAGDGSIVLVNRGFVAADDRGRVQPGGTDAAVTGLLRITEPGGAFLRHNAPAANQWYSRDVAAIAASHGLTHVAPYFIDAQSTQPAVSATSGTNPPSPSASAVAPANPASAGTNVPSTGTATETNPPSPSASAAPLGNPASVGTNVPCPGAAAGSTPSAGAMVAPTPGLTVIHFHNSHLVYAITWYTLALMTAIAIPVGMRKQ